jgi:hypothetical protein
MNNIVAGLAATALCFFFFNMSFELLLHTITDGIPEY